MSCEIGSVPPRGENKNVLANLSNGFGYSWDLFSGSFAIILIVKLSLFVKPFINAYKIILGIVFLLSGITMFLCTKSITKNKNIAILSSVVYMIMPYHLSNMYITNSLSECVCFVFIPLTFLGLYKLFNEKKSEWIWVLGSVGLIITSNIISIIFLIINFGYIIMYLNMFKDKKIREKFLFGIIFILCLSFFYLGPLFQTIFSSEYLCYQDSMKVTKEEIKSQSLNIKDLFVTQNPSKGIFELSLPVIIMLCFSVVTLRVVEIKKEYIFLVFVGFFSIFMTTKYFPWGIFGDYFLFFYSQTKIMIVSTFCFSIVCAINMGTVIKNYDFKDVIIISIISVIYVCSLNKFIPINDENTINIEDIDNIGTVYGIEDEFSVGMGDFRYLPFSASENLFYIASRESEIKILRGEGNIYNYEKNGSSLNCKIEAIKDDTVFEFPYIYYPGYKITIDGSPTEGFESENGFLAIDIRELPKSDVKIEYKGTALMRNSKIFSIISLFIFILYNIIMFREDNEVSEKY